MGASVLLLHRVREGEWHYDWMIERGGPGGLITFRVRERIDRDGVREFEAERIGDHRAEYLTFEGQVSGGRGTVERVARGEFEVVREGKGEIEVVGGWEGGRRLAWRGALRGERWCFSAQPPEGESGAESLV